MDSVVFATGARGSGKSSWLKQYARGFGRVLVWSPLEASDRYGQFLGVPVYSTPTTFFDAVTSGESAVWAVDRPTPEKFDWFCRVAWHCGPCLVLVDELADVTPVGKAVGGWGDLVRKGRHRGIEIAAGAQRPAEIDKTIIGNTTRIVSFRLARVTDRRLMADEIGVDRARLDALQPLEFIDCDRLTGRWKPLKLSFR